MLQRSFSSFTTSLRVISILIILLLLTSCGTHSIAQVSDRDPPPSRRVSTHRVVAGETLFSIAWRYGFDYRELARQNKIPAPFTIYPGQTIYLSGNKSAPPVASPKAATVPSLPPPMATKSAGKPPQVAPPKAQPKVNTTRPVTNPRSETTTTTRTPAAPLPLISGAPQWQWPASGKLIASFQGSSGVNKGIDIAGNLGQPVLAAAAGQVVYAGAGLRGYGNLLIIKHNESFLSAYAHNNHLVVKEGDVVKAGQKIADMGSSGTDRIKLHFEIRREGTPVDPMKYLPRR
jgi:lipoprotein NlpD